MPTRIHKRLRRATAFAVFVAAAASAQKPPDLDVTARIQTAPSKTAKHQTTSTPPAVLWLKPLTPGPALPAFTAPHGGFTLLQKNKTFTPHLLVVPTGSVVMFPNADPFFHNVFSLFDGQRFDLGLYEAGKTKAVTFSREGVSYIFCNIHSEMSAVVLSLSTPLYSIAEKDGSFALHNVPPGEYELHLWVEGAPQALLDRWVHPVRISVANRNLGTITVDAAPPPAPHSNKFGQPYDRAQKPPY
jgi:plastocyanin